MTASPPPAWQPAADPEQPRREAVFARWSRRSVVAVGALALAGALVPGDAGRVVAVVAIATVVALPLLRVMWLVSTWRRQRDRRFVATGVALLAVVALGVVAAALRGT